MPLFGSNFAQGFATGFAESASKSIDNAIAQRDADVSAAKKFAMTRAAQLEEQALEKDKRTQNAINKMAARFTKGDKTDWNRVYGAIMATDGGDLDSLDALFKNMKKTEEQGIKFDINDVFKYAEGDESLSNLSRDDIFQALRAEYEAPTVRATDTTFLSKVGLGAGETGGQRADEQVRGLFPGATRTAIEGDYGTTTLDQGALAAAVEYGMKVKEFEKTMTPTLAEAFASTAAKIGKLDTASPTYEEDRKKLEQEQARNIENIAIYTRATTEETTTPGAMTASGYARVVNDGKTSALALAGIDEKLGIYTDENGEVKRDGLVNPQGIASAKNRAINDYLEQHVRGQMDGNGELSFLGKQVILNDPQMKAIYDRITGASPSQDTTSVTATQTEDILTTPATDGAGTDAPAVKTKDDLTRDSYPTAAGYLKGAIAALNNNNTTPNYDKLLQNIMRIYNMNAADATDAIQKMIDDDAAEKKMKEIEEANKPTFKSKEQREAEAARQAENVQSSTFAFGDAG